MGKWVQVPCGNISMVVKYTLLGACGFRIKETWELWEVFSTDCRRFSEWLSTMEVEVGDAEADMPTAVGKDEIRKYEVGVLVESLICPRPHRCSQGPV